MRINELKTGVIISYATQAVNVLSGLVYTPVMLRLLGQSEYGLYQLVHSVVSYLSLLSLGFSSSYMRFYSRYKSDNNTRAIAKLNGMFMTIFLVIAMVCLACGGFMVTHIHILFGSGLTADEIYKAKILMIIMVVNMSLTFINSVFVCSITAHEKFFFQRIVEFFRALFNPFLTLPLLIMGYGSIGMVMITTFLTLLAMIINGMFCIRRLHTQYVFKGFDKPLLKEMCGFTFFIFINMIVDQLNWSIGKIMLGRIMGTVAVAVYGVASQLNSMYLILANSVSSVFIPRVNMMVATENNSQKITSLFTKVGRIQFIILALVLSGYVLFGQDFIYYWAGQEYLEAYAIGLLLMIPVTVPMVQTLGIEIQRAKNMHKARSIMYLFTAAFNVLISIPCIKQFGALGSAIGTALSITLGNGILMNLYYHKKIGLDIIYFWKQIMKLTPAISVSVAVGIIMRYILPMGSSMHLAVNMSLYCVIYSISMYILGLNNDEKKIISVPLKVLLHKK